MSKTNIPVVPLTNKVFLPGSSMTLAMKDYNICNPYLVSRGKKLKMFGIITYKDPSKKTLYNYGTLVGVASESPIISSEGMFPGLSMGLTNLNSWKLFVIGVERFKILSHTEENGTIYANIQVEKDKDSKIPENLMEELKNMTKAYIRSLPTPESVTNEREKIVSAETDPALLGFILVGYLDLPLAEKQALLENFRLEDRTRKLIAILNSFLSEDQLSQEVSEKMKQDLSKRMEIRKKELESKLDNGDDLQLLDEKLQTLEIPTEYKKTVSEEMKRLKIMRKISPEYNSLKTYLDLIVTLPWGLSSKDNYDIKSARIKLDSDHFGLEKVKKRILEYIAVRALRQDMKGSILCFTGPPGVGKTSLGKSIADAIGRKFVRIALGGVRDEAEIRGHRRTYVASMPGTFINAFKRCGTNNPVILLDEIDKVGTGSRGDPASALLEVLDPAQNSTFVDHYLGIPFDLSKVLFIATANHPEMIPHALLDRMEMIEITGYTIHEKVKIAGQYLIPKQVSENGLKSELLAIPDDVVSKIITDYTREAGVRQLERSISAICRWAAMKFISSTETPSPPSFSIMQESNLEEILGVPIFINDLSERVSIPGVAIGMAWTAVGGKIMLVETSKCPGQGGLKVTGQLGEVMKESVLTAISWIKVNMRDILPRVETLSKCEGFDGIDLHIHFPAAAVPKDGPSAGVTITTALVSLLTGIRARNDLAMTGEISLTGKVLPIGGVKEKVLGAHRMGIKNVILPRLNKKDIKEIPQQVKEEVKFILVDNVRDVLENALETSVLSNLAIRI